jgi:OFA family oxalate/formate antiporter-like MFS transporter
VIGVIGGVMVANHQYGWKFFVSEIQKTLGWDWAAIQIAFTLLETWLVPIEGWFVDKYGPSAVVLFGAVLCGLGWWMTSHATALGGLTGYDAAMIICGIGAGAVYGTCMGNALKWFPDKRGLAAGLTAAGFSAGSALTVIPDPVDDRPLGVPVHLPAWAGADHLPLRTLPAGSTVRSGV